MCGSLADEGQALRVVAAVQPDVRPATTHLVGRFRKQLSYGRGEVAQVCGRIGRFDELSQLSEQCGFNLIQGRLLDDELRRVGKMGHR